MNLRQWWVDFKNTYLNRQEPQWGGDEDENAKDDSLYRSFDEAEVENGPDPTTMAEARIKAWDGISVSDLPIDALNEYVVVETPLTFLKESVPIEYRAAQTAARVHGSPDNSLDWTQSTASIIAIDKQGMALVERYVHSNYDGAEGWSFDVMPQQNAFDLLGAYRASHVRAEQEISPETLEALQDLSELKLLVDPAARIHAVPGHTYSGEIAALETGGILLQAVGDGKIVAHQMASLTGEDARKLLGQNVQISYPCGHVGLVRTITDYHLQPSPLKEHQRAETERSI